MSDFTDLIDLAAEKLGGTVLWANDDFFAEKENLLKPEKPVFIEGKYTDRGKWMDGWESRRRRVPGHDASIIRLGLPGIVRGVVIDTAFFRGNYPDHASIEACAARADADVETLMSDATRWVEILPKSALRGDSRNLFTVEAPFRATHLRFHIYPDGGVARLRVHGDVLPDWRRIGRGGQSIDLAAIENGALALACSDMFFGERQNMLMPGRAANMGDGWETRRRRGPGYDWSLVRLAATGMLDHLEIDTNHFKGNYPDTCSVEGILAEGASVDELAPGARPFVEILPRTKLQAHTRHLFDEELRARGPFSHVRINVYPDGGISRLRVWGSVTHEGGAAARVRRLDALFPHEAEAELLACCGASAWARRMTAARPFGTPEALAFAADQVWAEMDEASIHEAFRAHPRIGERKAEVEHGAAARAWAEGEQAGARAASAETLAELAAANRAYEERFGHVYLVCATGKTADEMLAILRSRMDNSPAEELRVAAEEQRKITRLRLAKMLSP